MKPKIAKIRAAIDKNDARIAAWQEKNRALKNQLIELENTDIVGMVREIGMTPEELAELLASLPKTTKKKEVSADEAETA